MRWLLIDVIVDRAIHGSELLECLRLPKRLVERAMVGPNRAGLTSR